MPKVNVNKQHDYITVRVVWSKELTINMTWSRYGEKVSFRGLTEAHVRPILRQMKLPSVYKTNGEWIDAVAKAAETAADANALLAAMTKARTDAPASEEKTLNGYTREQIKSEAERMARELLGRR